MRTNPTGLAGELPESVPKRSGAKGDSTTFICGILRTFGLLRTP